VVDYLNTVLLFIFKCEPYEVLLPEIEKKHISFPDYVYKNKFD
jgi:hypothetical protein